VPVTNIGRTEFPTKEFCGIILTLRAVVPLMATSVAKGLDGKLIPVMSEPESLCRAPGTVAVLDVRVGDFLLVCWRVVTAEI